MAALPVHPNLYEVNTRVWIEDLRVKYRRRLTLDSVPASEWDVLAPSGIDAVWLMGVWERSPVGTGIAREVPGLASFARAHLNASTPDDIIGSPYCLRSYTPDQELGGFAGLAVARSELERRDLGLILDYVPNHVAHDHPWALDHPDYFLQGTQDDLADRPEEFVTVAGRVLALARDPYFPPWSDVLQLNAFRADARRAAAATVNDIAGRCDGVRCDMAVLMLNAVFARTWGPRAGAIPNDEYWPQVIGEVKGGHPEFLFIAESYWDLESTLLQQGFDYCYDKRLYDRLVEGEPEQVKLHLGAEYSYQSRLVRFVENHDEPRAAAVWAPSAHRAAAVAVATVPGATLYHQGQLMGRTIQLPAQLRRTPAEPPDQDLEAFYRILIAAGRHAKAGLWELCEVHGWPDNDSCRTIAAWVWKARAASHVIAVNFGAGAAQGRVQLPAEILAGDVVVLTDAISGEVFERSRTEIAAEGLYVGLDGHAFHFLRTERSQRS